MIAARLIALTGALTWAAAAQAEVRLDQLSDCAALRDALAAARAERGGCRDPRSAAERRITQAMQFGGASGCWMRTAPTARLGRFACFRMVMPGTSYHLDCMAPASPEDVEEFRSAYETRWAAAAADYVRRASQCEIGNGNAARAQRTLFLGPLSQVSRFEIGFALALGRDLTGNGIALHGYASGDPAVFPGARAVEFVSIWQRR